MHPLKMNLVMLVLMMVFSLASCGGSNQAQTGDELAKNVKAAIDKKDYDTLINLTELKGASEFDTTKTKNLWKQITSNMPVESVQYTPLPSSPDEGDIWVKFSSPQSMYVVGNATISPIGRVNFPAKKIDGVFRLHTGHDFGPDFAF